jgi:DNA-binding MarR family transcriptional regulator
MVGLNKISLALKSHAWQDAGLQGLTPTQGQILALLRSKVDSAMRLAEVADGLAVTPATASDAVATLVAKGLVQKGRAQDDARAIAITLTEQGQHQADRVADWPDFLLDAVDELSPVEQEVFLRGLIKMICKLQERGQIPISRMCVTCRFFQPNVYSKSDRPHHCALVNAPFGDRDLRLDCPEHNAANQKQLSRINRCFH